MIQSKTEENSQGQREGRENACESRLVLDLFLIGWPSGEWHEIFKPIANPSDAKQKLNANYF